MADLLTILGYSMLPALGAIVGALVAERTTISERRLSLALHGAAGVVVGVVALELMPRTLDLAEVWVVAGAFIVGGLIFIAVDRSTHVVAGLVGGGAEDAGGAWTLAFGVGLDLATDGLLVGAGSAVSPELGLTAAAGLVLVDLPEGFATTAAFKRHGVARVVRLGTIAGLALSVPVGATVGYLWLSTKPPVYAAVVLALTAGTLMTLLVEEISPSAHREGGERLAALVFLAGFGAFALIHALLA